MNFEQTSKLENAIRADCPNAAGLVILKDGRPEYEGGFNGRAPDSPIHVFSVTKSVISLLIGIAIDKGYIKSVNQKVLDFFPDYPAAPEDRTLPRIALRDLLTMTAPYKHEEEPYIAYFSSESWVRASLDLLGGDGNIGEFRYTPLVGPDILSGVLTAATGQSVLDFAAEHLFAPLGISAKAPIIFRSQEEQLAFLEAKDISGWVADPQGVNTAGWGLTLTAMELAKLGLLCLQNGQYAGKRLVSPAWIGESTREHSRWGELSYGYLWWVVGPGAYAALGDGGNTLYVNAEKNLTVALTALFRPNIPDRIGFIREHIEPLF